MEEKTNIENYLDFKINLDTYINLRARDDFLTFVKVFAPTLVSDFKMGKHIKLLCSKL